MKRKTPTSEHWYKQFLIEQREHAQAILERDTAIKALQVVRYELAALTQFPDEPNFQSACPNSADADCLMRAYAETNDYKK